MSRHERLCACLGYSVRIAQRDTRQDVAALLWHCLYILTQPDRDHRIPISLHASLGLDDDAVYERDSFNPPEAADPATKSVDGGLVEDDQDGQRIEAAGTWQQLVMERSTQTVENMMSDMECKALTEEIVRDAMSKAHEAIHTLTARLEDLEGGATTIGSNLHSGRFEATDGAVKNRPSMQMQNWDVADIDKIPASCQVSALSSSLASHSVHAPLSLHALRAQHQAQRIAQKEARRKERLGAI